MRLLVDLESTGLYRFKLPADDPSQPNIVQLGAALFDREWRVVGKIVTLIRPDGWTCEPEAEAIHGISSARCSSYGIPIVSALSVLKGMTACATQIIGHNVSFDYQVIKSQIVRCGGEGTWWERKSSMTACTMHLTTDICQLPPLPGRNGYKWPKLDEAHRHLLPDQEYQSVHDAEDDLMATARIAQELERRALLPAPFSPMAPFQRMGT